MLVSVIIPCFNVENYIIQCIDSVINQSYTNIEIICVENNSSDNTPKILAEICERYPNRINVIKELKQGAPAARNKGLSLAKGEWIQFLDADDLLLPEKIAHQLNITNNENGFIASSYYREQINGKREVAELKIRDPYKAVFVTNLGITSANLFSIKCIKNIKGWNEFLNSSQEADLMFRLLKRDTVVIFDEIPMTIVRERESGQISQRNPQQKWMQYISVRLEIIHFLKSMKQGYFTKEASFYYNSLFLQLRILALYSIKDANDIYRNNFEKGFVPLMNFSDPIYIILFRLLGFKRTEQLKKIIKKFR